MTEISGKLAPTVIVRRSLVTAIELCLKKRVTPIPPVIFWQICRSTSFRAIEKKARGYRVSQV